MGRKIKRNERERRMGRKWRKKEENKGKKNGKRIKGRKWKKKENKDGKNGKRKKNGKVIKKNGNGQKVRGEEIVKKMEERKMGRR